MLLDITRLIRTGMPVYPGEPGPELAPVKRMAQGDTADVTAISFGLHTGTHVDAPRHFLPGHAGAHELPLDALCGPAQVALITDPFAVTEEELDRVAAPGVRRLLLKTRNSAEPADRFHENFVFVSPQAAAWLVDRHVLLVGIDGPSVEQFGAPYPAAHRTLLGGEVVIVENLDLTGAAPGTYELMCLPLKVKDGDGAPCRAVLVEPAPTRAQRPQLLW